MESNWKSLHAQAARENRDKWGGEAQIDVKYPLNPVNMSFKTFCLCKQGKKCYAVTDVPHNIQYL